MSLRQDGERVLGAVNPDAGDLLQKLPETRSVPWKAGAPHLRRSEYFLPPPPPVNSRAASQLLVLRTLLRGCNLGIFSQAWPG